MTAASYDFTIEQGTTFTRGLKLKKGNGLPVNLTGYTGVCQIRTAPDSVNIIASPTITFDVDRKSGRLVLILDAATTAALNFYIAYYNLDLTSGSGVVTRILSGKVTLSKEITH